MRDVRWATCGLLPSRRFGLEPMVFHNGFPKLLPRVVVLSNEDFLVVSSPGLKRATHDDAYMLGAIVFPPKKNFSGYRGPDCLLVFHRRCFFDAARWECRCYFHLSEVGGLAGYILYTGVYLTCVEIGVGATLYALNCWHACLRACPP